MVGKFNFFPPICFLFSHVHTHPLTLVHCFLQLSPFALKSLSSTLWSLWTVQPCVLAGRLITPDAESVCWSSVSFLSNKPSSSHSISVFSIIPNTLFGEFFVTSPAHLGNQNKEGANHITVKSEKCFCISGFPQFSPPLALPRQSCIFSVDGPI